VVIEDRHVASPAEAFEAGSSGHVAEGAVLVIVIEDVLLLGRLGQIEEVAQTAVVPRVFVQMLRSPAGAVDDEQIEKTVVVVVEEDSGLGVARRLKRQPGLLGHILELAVAQILEEDIAAARAGDEKVLPAVAVVVGPSSGDADAIAQANAGLLGHVFKGAISLVAVEGAFAFLVAKEDIVVAVVVEIADRHAAAVVVEVGLELFALFVGEKRHAKRDAGLSCHIAETGVPPRRIVTVGFAPMMQPLDRGYHRGPREREKEQTPEHPDSPFDPR